MNTVVGSFGLVTMAHFTVQGSDIMKERSIPCSAAILGLCRFLHNQGIMAVKPKNPKYVAKHYEQMHYPGQRIQIDVKFVPLVCLLNEVKGKRFYQYTAIDE